MMLRYSLDHLCQKCLTKVWHSCQRRKREREGWARDVSRMELRGLPMRKCPGVRASMPSSPADSRGVRGRLFKHASTCVRMVENSSNVSLVLPITFFRCILALLTATYHKPPKCGVIPEMEMGWKPRGRRHYAMRSDTKKAEDALSNRHLASMEEPLGTVSKAQQVIKRHPVLSLMAVFAETGVEGGASSRASTCNKVWWGPWQSLHLCMDLQFLMWCPLVRQLWQTWLFLKNDNFCSWGIALNLLHIYKGCFSFLQRCN